MNTDNTTMVQKIVHLRPKYNSNKKDGSVTIATRLIKSEDGSPLFIKYAVAFMSPKDQFTKKIGAKIALERLDGDPSRITESNVYCHVLNVTNRYYNNDMLLMAVVSDILLNMPYPRSAKNVLLNKFVNNYREPPFKFRDYIDLALD